MGELNILPRIGQNKLPEVYVIGQLHVNIFEETKLPDMALINRQGYKDDNLRYKVVLKHAQKLLADIISKRGKWSDIKNEDKRLKKIQKIKKNEEKFKKDVLTYKSNVIKEILSFFNS